MQQENHITFKYKLPGYKMMCTGCYCSQVIRSFLPLPTITSRRSAALMSGALLTQESVYCLNSDIHIVVRRRQVNDNGITFERFLTSAKVKDNTKKQQQ